MSERQIKILQERSDWAKGQIAKAQEALSKSSLNGDDYVSAYQYSKSALDALPSSGESTAGLRSLALDTFSRAAFGLTTEYIAQKHFSNAEDVVAVATGKPYSSTYPPLLSLKKNLQNPDYFNRTETPQFDEKLKKLKQFSQEAQGYYDTARYDQAYEAWERVLNIDPQNDAARLGMEQINQKRSSYAQDAYNERRSEMLDQVSKAWETPVQKFEGGATSILEQPPIDLHNTGAISKKLRDIKIDKLSLSDETIREAIDKLQNRSRALDTNNNQGVNIVLKVDPTKESVDGGTKITLSLSDVTLEEALKYVAAAADLQVKIEPYAVAIVPKSEPIENLSTKEYKVPPGFISSISTSGSTPSAGAATPGLPQTTGRSGAKEFLAAQGVTFPPGASAIYLPSSSKLLVKNTQSNLDLIDSIVEVATSAPQNQVEVEARFLEVTQNNIQELGFDWLLGAFNLPAGSGVYGGGGTKGNQQGGGPYPFTPPGGAPIGSINGADTGNLTSGNRTGSAAIKANALDGLLFGSPAGPAAGVLALAGVFTNPQFQVVLRAINQQKGVDLVSAPKVTVQNGQKATINITRKFPYPRTYSPPQVPQSQGGGVNPATPATPTDFETRKVGVELEVQPTIGPDNQSIDLNLSPQITEFQGFVNYGTPIQTIAPIYVGGTNAFNGVVAGTKTVVLTPNLINQPVFSVREVTTQVTIYDGQTVVLGGLMREDVQKVQDKTPILGDMPLVGSLFRSSANQRIKRNLLIFVSALLLDPSGQSLLKSSEKNPQASTPDEKTAASQTMPAESSTESTVSR